MKIQRTGLFGLAVAMLMAVCAPVAAGSPTNETAPAVLLDEVGTPIEEGRADYFLRVRESFGLSADRSTIQQTIDAHGIDQEWGFPLSPAELLDMEHRVALQAEVTDDVLERIWSVPGYAGLYFDHGNGGAPTVLLVGDETNRALLTEAVPTDIAEGLVVLEAGHTWTELVNAANDIASSDDRVIREQVHRVSIKVVRNQLEITILDAAKADEVRTALPSTTTVPFGIQVEPRSEPAGCTSRTICYSPHRAGVQVNGGGSSSTLGFGIYHNADRQYVVAGHHSASTYSHYIYNLGGTAESEYFDNGIDARAVYAPDSQVSDDIYVSSTFARDVIGTKYPSVGLSVCKCGISTACTCGTVQDDYLLYSFSSVQDLLGASANFYALSGDSGGPVYQISGSSSAYAVGIISGLTGDIEFARTYDFYGRMGATVLTY